jgi:hypothetical protein
MRPESGSGSQGSQERRVSGSGPEHRGARGDPLGCDASPRQLRCVVIAGLKFTVRIGRVCATVVLRSHTEKSYGRFVGYRRY